MKEQWKPDPSVMARMEKMLGHSQDQVPVFPEIFDLLTGEYIMREVKNRTEVGLRFYRMFLKMEMEQRKKEGSD